MRTITFLLFFYLIINTASAEDFNLKVSDFFGECNYSKVEKIDLTENAYCISNFINPSINFNLLTAPFTQLYNDIFGIKTGEITVNPSDDVLTKIYKYIVGLVSSIVSLPFAFINFFINFFMNFVRFALHFMFRFAIIYLFWISIGFQTLINLIDRDKSLLHEEKVTASFALMAVATVWAMLNGVGFIQWS